MIFLPKSFKWQNPFIKKLEDNRDIIFSFDINNINKLKESVYKLLENRQKVILEPCSGSGSHIIELAKLNPDHLCIGIELRFKRLVKTAEKAKKEGLENLRLIQADAGQIEDYFPGESIDKIYINFPDPWDGKIRWKNNYLINSLFIGSLHNLLKPAGSFYHKTDHMQRFYITLDLLAKCPEKFKVMEKSEDLHKSEYNCKNIPTEFERLFTHKKLPVFYLKAQKVS